jgi:hypothetical protein
MGLWIANPNFFGGENEIFLPQRLEFRRVSVIRGDSGWIDKAVVIHVDDVEQ